MRTYLFLAALLLISPALAQDAATFAKQLGDADAAKREAAATGLAKLGPESLPALDALLAATKDRAFKVRVAAIRALVAIGPKASEASHKRLLGLLQDKSAQVREEAAKAFPPLRLASKSLPQLASLFGDQKWRVRAAAIEAISSTGKAAEPLTEELLSLSTGDASPTVRRLAAAASKRLEAALGRESKSPKAGAAAAPSLEWTAKRVPALVAALRTEKDDAHFYALQGIENLGPLAGSALPDLLELLADATHAEHHAAYVRAIATLGEEAVPAIPTLLERLKHAKKSWARYYAAIALGRIGPLAEAAVPALLEAWDATTDGSLRNGIGFAIGRICTTHPAALERLIKVYPDADRHAQKDLGAAIAGLGPAGAKFLLSRAGDSDLSAAERSRALEAAAATRGAEEAVAKAAWLALKSDAKADLEVGSRGLQTLAAWSPLGLEKFKLLCQMLAEETDPGRKEVLELLVSVLKNYVDLHELVKVDPATPAAIPALLVGLDKSNNSWAEHWLKEQAKRNAKVVDALWAHVGRKTDGRAYDLLCELTGLKKGEQAPPRGDEAPESKPESSSAGDLSHVKVGQVYVYELEAGGVKMQMNYVVEKVEGTSVHYSTETVVAGMTTKGPVTTWKTADPKAAPAKPPANNVKTRFETFEFQGESWQTMVVESDGSTTWVLLKGGAPTFPPFVKTEGASKATLVKIEQR